MIDEFRILFVDDEETFLYSTTDLLRREGFQCDGAPNLDVAQDLLRRHVYDLVIADIRMPGNCELEFARQLAATNDGLSIILVTGHPSLASAVQSVELPVVAYLVKPFDFEELAAKVRAVARQTEVRRVLRNELARVLEYRQGLLHVEANLAQHPRTGAQSLQVLVGITLRNILDGLSSLHSLIDSNQEEQRPADSRHFGATIPHGLRDVLHDAVATLDRTRSSFKSKELGELRRRLEALLRAPT